MEHFKEFLIRLQTFDIEPKQKQSIKLETQANGAETNYYDLSHENPHLSQAFSNQLKKLKGLALTDLLTLQPEQIAFQLKHLEQIKGRFQDFWKRYYDKPLSIEENNRQSDFFHLGLNEDFIVSGLEAGNPGMIFTDQFFDDLCDSVQARENIVRNLEDDVNKILTSEKSEEIKWADKYSPSEGGVPSFSSPEIIEAFYRILHPYFLDEDRQQLAGLLQANHSEAGLLLFNGFGNQLADAFKQLLDANLVVGCTPGELEKWIAGYFLYRDKGKPKKFTEKYLNDIISSTTKQCQSPILDVKKKEDGQFGIFPAQRTRKNYKK